MRARTSLAVLTALLLWACGASDTKLSAAAFQLRLGDLDRAEAILEDATGQKADALRAKIAAVRARRAGLDGELAALDGLGHDELLAALQERLSGEADPVLRDRIEREISRVYDERAERSAARGFARGRLPGDDVVTSSEGGAPTPPPLTDPILDEVLAEVARARDNRSWAEADGILRMVLDDAPEYTERLTPILRQVETSSSIEGRELLRRATGLERQGRLVEAEELVERELWRFPDRGDCAELHRRVEQLAQGAAQEHEPGRGAVEAATAAGPEVRGPGPEALAAVELAVQAGKLEGRGEYGAAVALWERARVASELPTETERYRLRGLAARARHAFRADLAAAFEADPGAFASTGVQALAPTALTINGTDLAWTDVVPSTLHTLAGVVELSDEGRLGLALEKLDRDEADGSKGGLADLHRLNARGALDDVTTWRLVAVYRREVMPENGYVWEGGEWISSLELERERIGAELDALAAEIARGSVDERDAAFAALRERAITSEAARIALDGALRERFTRSVAAVQKGRTFEQVERVANQRAQLDALRKHALELIFDTETYFYPYDPPAAGSGKTVGDYWAAQREVDERVGAVRAIWDAPLSAELPRAFRDALAEIDWIRLRHVHVRGSLLLPEGWPAWITGIDASLERVDLATFALDRRERTELARDRRVRAWNEARWETDETSNVAERNQVRITNDYRVMLGRRALAWNARIHEAARWHSNYMANTGNFGHTEPEDPDNRTPFDRMRRVGYERGASENCHRGSGGPRAAHDGWTHSSGHHRNLLMASHREMASAVVAGYWTQNFGAGTQFETELDAWRD